MLTELIESEKGISRSTTIIKGPTVGTQLSSQKFVRIPSPKRQITFSVNFPQFLHTPFHRFDPFLSLEMIGNRSEPHLYLDRMTETHKELGLEHMFHPARIMKAELTL
jgi:hypothetical protein